ncbi:hypothetical protein DPMN_174260 [Dreissena polymorpha]|uniref:Uncharacterized protein n=1 Tax=Dreissena polymorpha TaxID=45954 RepID=A0A9D4IG80_DREPO|nr:hypothetical protein DPMN_174227 [Dreissena polymorpha]KAH3772913.1 hypothetical protein DPMN_174260 [Dreissena polymorpha]
MKAMSCLISGCRCTMNVSQVHTIDWCRYSALQGMGTIGVGMPMYKALYQVYEQLGIGMPLYKECAPGL